MHWDYVIIGSGFGGSVSALRLAEKGYKVLVLEKGQRFAKEDFPKSNWNVKRWLWAPGVGFRGPFKMTFMRHVTVLSGVGVGGGSLVYANTLPIPADEFFTRGAWSALADWKRELAPHYGKARQMLGATVNPDTTTADTILQELAQEDGRPEAFERATVAVYFDNPGTEVDDPYFEGRGPRRTGCTRCGGCMLGCRVGAKNTLDRNYLYLAERLGAEVRADTEVTWVRPLERGYEVAARGADGETLPMITTDNIVFAGGVLGTVELLLKLRESDRGLPKLSPRVGDYVRTNAEALIGVSSARDDDLSRGIAIGSIYNTDAHSHIEPVRFPAGSSFFRVLVTPHVSGATVWARLAGSLAHVLRHPLEVLRFYTLKNFAQRTLVLLYMRTLEGHLRMRLASTVFSGGRRGLATSASGEPPRAACPEATTLAYRVAKRLGGIVANLFSETLLDVPTTAHILGGACMGASPAEGVIDDRHRIFGYDGLYVIDGSAVSANPGVNPSLTITALAERAMAFIPENRETRLVVASDRHVT